MKLRGCRPPRPAPPRTRDPSLRQTVDALPRLSPRSLKDSVDAANASPGRYLTVDDGGTAGSSRSPSGSSASAVASR